MEKIIGIYDADAGFKGEFKYIFEKIFYKKHCALCDITHGFSFSAKKEWQDKVDNFPIPIETLHLNEVDSDVQELIKGKSPCVVHIKDDYKNIIINKKELEECQKDPNRFFELLREKLNI